MRLRLGDSGMQGENKCDSAGEESDAKDGSVFFCGVCTAGSAGGVRGCCVGEGKTAEGREVGVEGGGDGREEGS